MQHLYQNPSTRAKLFALLESDLAPSIDKRNGRPGMTFWSIFVCGVIRLDLNIDYDRLHELVNQHNTLRQMLGHGQFDATRKVIELTADHCAELGRSDWRQHAYNLKQLKRGLRAAQSAKHSKARNDAQKEKNDARLIAAHTDYLELAQGYLDKARETLAKTAASNTAHLAARIEIEAFITHAERQIDQTRRRVMLGETIPHAEKVFSVFETHTEWISKGKAGVPVELGLRVCV